LLNLPVVMVITIMMKTMMITKKGGVKRNHPGRKKSNLTAFIVCYKEITNLDRKYSSVYP